VVVRWALLVPVRIWTLENVEEFISWGPVVKDSKGKLRPCSKRKGETFDGFIKSLTTGISPKHPAWSEMCIALNIQFDIQAKLKLFRGLGYQIEHKVLAACDYGVATTRKRFYLTARNDGRKIVWPKKTHGKKKSGLKPFKTTADIIDWSIPMKSIFGRKKPLVPNTLARIGKGIQKFVIDNPDPFIVRIGQTGFGGDNMSYSINQPLTTITSKAEHLLVVPIIDRQFGSSTCNSVEVPLGTITAGGMGKSALVTSHIIKFRGDNIGHKTDEPLHTISAGGFHLGEVRAFMIKYYGSNIGHTLNEPLHTIAAKDRFALVTIKGEEYQIVDICLRMLEPHELFAASGFPNNYIINIDTNGKKVSKAKQVARVGNAVCPPVAEAIVSANLASTEFSLAA